MTDRLLAALMFFTRLPWGRIRQVDSECFRHVVDYWPFAGWLTGGCLAVVYASAVQVFPPATALILAFAARMLLTGALHEDGLADFCDGTGGCTPERRLAIMKDSHIGTLGVLGLGLYFGLSTTTISALPPATVPLLLFTADIYAKTCAMWIVRQLPYARTEREAKARVVYTRPRGRDVLLHLCRGLLALLPAAVWYVWYLPLPLLPVFLAPSLTELALVRWMRRRLGGYTGDCCGATFLLCELSFYLLFYIVHTLL